MIGLPSFLLELAFPTVLTVMFVAALVDAARRRNFGAAVAAFLVLGFGALVGSRLYFQVQSRRSLQSLRPAEVKRILVGKRRITRPEQIAAVVKDLNRIEWFSSNHGGWRERRWLVIELKSGERRAFPIAKYQREEGAVIHFGRPPGGGGFSDGYAFSRALPGTLDRIGVRLE
jgi:hypothetical protein